MTHFAVDSILEFLNSAAMLLEDLHASTKKSFDESTAEWMQERTERNDRRLEELLGMVGNLMVVAGVTSVSDSDSKRVSFCKAHDTLGVQEVEMRQRWR